MACALALQMPERRLNVTLDEEHATKLATLAERMHAQPGTVARSRTSTRSSDPTASAGDTRDRVRASVRSLGRFPRLGAPLEGAWRGLRFLLGPWQWMVIVHVHLEEDDRVVVLTIQDGRSSAFVRGPSRASP